MIQLIEVLLKMTAPGSRVGELEKYRDAVKVILETGEERDTLLLAALEVLDSGISAIRNSESFIVDAASNIPEPGNTPVVGYAQQSQKPTDDFNIRQGDPNGLDPHAPGAKLDAGKVMAGLCIGDFARALYMVSQVATYGAKKYSRSGWLHVEDGENRYKDALYRHLLASEYEELDPESGLPHRAHAAWNMLAWLELKLRKAVTSGN